MSEPIYTGPDAVIPIDADTTRKLVDEVNHLRRLVASLIKEREAAVTLLTERDALLQEAGEALDKLTDKMVGIFLDEGAVTNADVSYELTSAIAVLSKIKGK